MNELTALREAAPQPAPLSPAVRLAARAALMDEIAGRGTALRVHRPARRRLWLRAGVGVVAVAAAWATAVVVAAPDPASAPASSVDLVAFAPPTFPFSLDPAPAGLQPSYSADPGSYLHATWTAEGFEDSLGINVSPEEPDLEDPTDEQAVTVQGHDGRLATENVAWGTDSGGTEIRPREILVLEWADDQWVVLSGQGRFDDRAELLDVAQTLTATPVPVGLTVGLAPAGWSVYAYKDGTILTLANDDAPEQTLTVSLPGAPIPADQLLAQLMGPTGPISDVTVHGLPAQLVPVDTGYTGPGRSAGWYLQAQLPGGQTFVVQAPGAFTQQQVLDLAEQVTTT
jgi:hypothetical protein